MTRPRKIKVRHSLLLFLTKKWGRFSQDLTFSVTEATTRFQFRLTQRSSSSCKVKFDIYKLFVFFSLIQDNHPEECPGVVTLLTRHPRPTRESQRRDGEWSTRSYPFGELELLKEPPMCYPCYDYDSLRCLNNTLICYIIYVFTKHL